MYGGFESYKIEHETYALTRLIYFVITGKSVIETNRNKKFNEFIQRGILDDLQERYSNINEMKVAFEKTITTFK